MPRRITITVDDDVWRIIINAKAELEKWFERDISVSKTINILIRYLHEKYDIDTNRLAEFVEERLKESGER